MEHREQADELEREADRLEHESERVEDDIEDTRRDWESKKEDAQVPGAAPDPAAETQHDPDQGGGADEEGAGARPDPEETEESAGVPGEEETSTGNPDAAGAED